MDLQLQGGQSLGSVVEHIQMEEEMTTPTNILNTTLELVLVFPCKTDHPQRLWISNTTAERTVQLLCKIHPLYPARLSEISEAGEELELQIMWWFIVVSEVLKVCSRKYYLICDFYFIIFYKRHATIQKSNCHKHTQSISKCWRADLKHFPNFILGSCYWIHIS